ncbi:MAG TPA: hypothetical protein DHV02_02240 [Neisseriales bacterium]|nr:hypothetical protein [Neisseriales bacterium]
MNSLHLSNYDFIFGAIIVVSVVFGVFRGGVAELLSMSTWFIALFVMRKYSADIEKIIPQLVSNGMLRSLLSYIIAFVAVAIIIMLIKIMFHRFIHSLGLGGLNYFIGALFGIARGLVISALIIVVVEMFTMDEKHSWQSSIISPLLVPTVNLIVNQFNSIKRIDFEAAHQANFFKNQASEILSK